MMVDTREHAERAEVPPPGNPVSCEEFQDQMPALLGESIRDHEHLKTCARCSALLDDLEYIVSIARDLLPAYEPGDSVWQKIQDNLAAPGSIGSGLDISVNGNGHLKAAPAEG